MKENRYRETDISMTEECDTANVRTNERERRRGGVDLGIFLENFDIVNFPERLFEI